MNSKHTPRPRISFWNAFKWGGCHVFYFLPSKHDTNKTLSTFSLNFQYPKTENEKHYLYRQATVISVHGHCSNPVPVKAHGQSCHCPSLVNIAGDCSEEVGKLSSVTQTGTASHEADLSGQYRNVFSNGYFLETQRIHVTLFFFSIYAKLTIGTEKGINILDSRMPVDDAAPPMSSGTGLFPAGWKQMKEVSYPPFNMAQNYTRSWDTCALMRSC